jgi:CheY-like chemotaxis protein
MSLLKGHDKFRFAFATTNPTEVIQKIEQNPIDVLLTDVMMPVLPGNQLAKKVKEKFPFCKNSCSLYEWTRRSVNEMINDAIFQDMCSRISASRN